MVAKETGVYIITPACKTRYAGSAVLVTVHEPEEKPLARRYSR